MECPKAAGNDENSLNVDSIYRYYIDSLLPAVLASLPVLVERCVRDVKHLWKSSNLDQAPQLASSFEVLDQNGDGVLSFEEWMPGNASLSSNSASSTSFWLSFPAITLLSLLLLSMTPGCLHGWMARLLRWPVLLTVYAIILLELAVYMMIRLVVVFAEFVVANPKHRMWRRRLKQSASYEAWYETAQHLDASQARTQWQSSSLEEQQETTVYNWKLVHELLLELQSAREEGHVMRALAILQHCTRKNVGGIMSPDLFSYTNTGEPKQPVTEFVNTVVETLEWITDEAQHGKQHLGSKKELFQEQLQTEIRHEKEHLWKTVVSIDNDSEEAATSGSSPVARNRASPRGQRSSRGRRGPTKREVSMESKEESSTIAPALDPQELLQFLKRARAAYGRTALCLSGGAMMGMYHFGHILGLLETGCLPHVVSGTSAGSVVGAFLCCRTVEELEEDMKPEVLVEHLRCFSVIPTWRERLGNLYRTGHVFTFEAWNAMVEWFTCGPMTFAEAYRKTGRVYCITVSSTTRKASPVLLNYLTAPNVVISSAVVASGAVPGLVPPVQLLYKDADGTIRKSDRDETYFDGSIRHDIPTNGLAEMLNCQFFVVCQTNPHVVPFFFGNKGTVGRPSRWSSGNQESSWRGGFLLTAIEMFLKNDMKAKFVFLNEIEAAIGFTSTIMTQDFVGSTTIVPQVTLCDYLRILRDPLASEIYHYMQRGAVAAYEHVAMIRLHYRLADVLEECIGKLQGSGPPRPRPQLKFPACRKQHDKKRRTRKRFKLLRVDSLNVSGHYVNNESSTTCESPADDDYDQDWSNMDR